MNCLKCTRKTLAIVALSEALGALMACAEYDVNDKALAKKIDNAETITVSVLGDK